MNGLGEWREQSVVSVERHCGNSVCPVAQPLALKQRPNGESTHVLSTVEQGETLLGGEVDGLPSHLLVELLTRDDLALILYMAEADERQTEVSQRHEVARGAHATLLIDNGAHAVVEELDETLHGV